MTAVALRNIGKMKNAVSVSAEGEIYNDSKQPAGKKFPDSDLEH